MKKIALIIALVFSVTLSAQENKPKMENEGDLVKATFFHDNGEIAQIGFYKNDKPHGEWIAFNQVGDKIAKGTYDMGVKVGKWFFWNDGVLSEVDFENGRVINVTKWDNAKSIVVN
jgi:antitoxin component YwqK of YwqJK toxin-antitoxin module